LPCRDVDFWGFGLVEKKFGRALIVIQEWADPMGSEAPWRLRSKAKKRTKKSEGDVIEKELHPQ